jgi:hypothetical protein
VDVFLRPWMLPGGVIFLFRDRCGGGTECSNVHMNPL